jgi:hypothetical protein
LSGALGQNAGTLGVAPGLSPGATALVVAAELVALGRIGSGLGPVAHSGQLDRGEQLELPHS